MKIAVIGAGFTGLAAARLLTNHGASVTVFEKDEEPGGLALGFQDPKWEWSLEKHYHHWFTNDQSILTLAKNVGYDVFIKRPKTSVLVDGKSYQLDSPLSVLGFPKLSLPERVRMGVALGLLRYNPLWKPLENFKTTDVLPKLMGQRAYQMLWEPQLKSKFGTFFTDISLAWFWARVHKRTPSLAYPNGGFLPFARQLAAKTQQQGATVHFATEVQSIDAGQSGVQITFRLPSGKTETEVFDKALVTLPSFFFLKIVPQLPETYKKQLERLQGLGAINLVLRLKKPFLQDGTYWLSVCEKNAPVMAVVEHTNFMDKKYYNNEHIVYLGNYLPSSHESFKLDENQLLAKYHPFLKRINASYRKELIKTHLFKVPYAQPIIPLYYSKIIPPFKTPLPGVFLANIQQVYPWDRGTNYAVELGEKAGRLLLQKDA